MFLGFCATFFLIPLGTSPFLVAGFLTLSIWVFSGRFIRDSNLWLRERWALPLMAFLALHWTGLLYTNDLPAGVKFAWKTHYWLFAFAMMSIPFHRYSQRALIGSFLAGLSLAALIHIAINTGVIPAPDKYRASFINPITYMLLLTFGIVLLSYFFARTQELKYKALYCAGMFLFLASLSLFAGAPGRTALLSLAAMVPVIVYNCLGQKSFLKILALTLLAAGILFFLPVVQTSLFDTMKQIRTYYGGGDPNTSIGLRLHMWSGAVKIFLENPLIGIGTGGYELEMTKYPHSLLDPSFRLSQPHNSFLYMAVSFGIPGLVVLVWLFFELLRSGWNRRTGLPGFASLIFAVIMLSASFTDTQIIQVHSGMLFAMLTGFQAASEHLERRRE